ncbi:MAG: alkaline phosphatase family protein [Bacillota bacterium]|nr:alkaline phosphatase family protein [Bacillota bacterium]
MDLEQERPRVYLFLLDGLRLDVALEEMTFLQSLVAQGQGRQAIIRGAVPSLSRPCYATIATGLWPRQHGITRNFWTAPLKVQGVFHVIQSWNRLGAASAYHWWEELHRPARSFLGRPQGRHAIPLGHYYREDDYPAEEVFAAARQWVEEEDPDFLLVHPMNVDDRGHKFGGLSPQYRREARVLDELLSLWVPDLLRNPMATVLVTSDHGMGEDGTHGADEPSLTHVPLWAFGRSVLPGQGGTYLQTSLAPSLLALLALPAPRHMAAPLFDFLTSLPITVEEASLWN